MAASENTTHLDIELFREAKGGNPDLLRESQRRRFKSVELVDEVIALDKRWREEDFKLNELQRRLNALSKENAKLRKENRDVDPAIVEQCRQINEEIPKQVEVMTKLLLERDRRLNSIGNLVHESVPVSKNEDDNAVIELWGQDLIAERSQRSRKFSHVDLVLLCEGADLERGVNVAGSRGYFLRGELVLLNQALIQYGIGFMLKRGATPVQPPFFMQKSMMQHCAQLEQFDEELYHVTGEGEDKYLIATSEQPIAAMHRNEAFDDRQLPIRYVGISTNFRKEVGSHGRDTLGIFRIHQFEKVEQFVICSPHNGASWAMLEEMIGNSKDFYQSLGLPYRVISIVSGALNNAAAKKYDLEGWFPAGSGGATYRELVSCSNCTDYQARKLRIRFGQSKKQGQKAEYVHMLNSTLCATERLMCCILENYQVDDGILIPDVLKPFMHGVEKIPFRVDPSVVLKKQKALAADKST